MKVPGGIKVIRFFLILYLIGVSIGSQAQEKILKSFKSDSIDFINQSAEEQKNQEELKSEGIYVDRHPTDTEIGSFEIQSSNKNFLMRIGGFAKLAAYYDAGLENELFFDLYKISPYGEKPLGRFNLQAYESRINMEVFGNTSLGLFRIFIEGDFVKDNNGGFRLRHAMGQFRGFTFGQTWTYFMDLAATPTSIDFYGTNAATFARKPLLGYKYVKENNFEVGASIENPNGNLFRDQNSTRPQVYPDVVGKFTKYFGEHHLQVAGIFRTFIYKNSFTDDEKVTEGFGVYVSGRAKIIKDLSLLGQVVYGKGIADYLGGDYVLLEYPSGDFYPPRMVSSVLGVNYKINFRSEVNAFGSYVNLLDNEGLEDNTFKDGFQVNVNYFYDVLPNLVTGAEIIYGQNINKGGEPGNATRYYLMFRFSF